MKDVVNLNLPESVTIVEVGPRDGLQNEDAEVSTENKIGLIDCLSRTGLKRIEVTSFTHPAWIPRLQDAESVMNGLNRGKGICYSALVPNRRGYERAMKCGTDEIVLLVSASETHNRKNVNRTIAETLEDLRGICSDIVQSNVKIRGSIAMAFQCPFEGKIPVDRVLYIVKEFKRMGAYEVALADTAGLAHPAQVWEVFSKIYHNVTEISLAGHFHNTYGFALANVFASLQNGVRIFDASVGGLGGCPYIPEASGNIATEDLVYMMETMGIETYIDLPKLMKCSRLINTLIKKTGRSCLAEKMFEINVKGRKADQ
ncbi:MAG: hydroxymethylglutaryl-CoA lyase [Thermodesulfobacteriota bacterium]|nr:hydroxymethylglutaryl-CoA lyase [Thermodesulfobacteriota bacterium]